MYLRHVQLQHWGCHDNLAIALEQGLNVCVGPNGRGKSTLYQAILAALTQKHSTKAEEIRAIQPWGTDGCGPTAVLEIVRSGKPWRLTKRYLHEATCLLECLDSDSGPSQRKNQVAETELDTWLEGDGAAGQLIVALWSPQNDPTQVLNKLPKNGTGRVAPTTLLERAVDRMGRPEASGPFASLKKAAADQYGRIFTPKELGIKRHSDLDRARNELAEAEAERQRLADRRQELEAAIEAYRVRKASHTNACIEAEALRRRRDELTGDLARSQETRQALEQAEARWKALRDDLDQKRQLHNRLTRADADLARARAALGTIEPARAQAKTRRDEAERALKGAEDRQRGAWPELDKLASHFDHRHRLKETLNALARREQQQQQRQLARDEAAGAAEAEADRLERARQEVALRERALAAAGRRARREAFLAADDAWTQAEAAYRDAETAALAHERAQLHTRLTKLRNLNDRLLSLDPSDDGGPVPTPEQLTALQKTDSELYALAESLMADSLTMKLVAATGLAIRLAIDGEPPREQRVRSGETIESEGAKGFALDIEGVGRIVLHRTSTDVAERFARRERDMERFEAELHRWNVRRPDELEARLRRAQERERLHAQFEALLGDQPIEALEARKRTLDATLAERGADPDQPAPTRPTADLDALRRRLDRAAQARAAAEALCGEDSDEVDGPDDAPPVAQAERELATAKEQLGAVGASARRATEALAQADSALRTARQLRDEADRALRDEIHDGDPKVVLGGLDLEIAAVRQALVPLSAQPRGETRDAVRLIKDEIENDLKARRAARDAAVTELNRLEQEWAAAESEHRNQAERLRELREGADWAGPADERGKALKVLETECVKAETECLLRRQDLPADPALLIEEIAVNLAAIEQRCHEGEVALANLQGELNSSGAEGLDSQWVALTERCDRLRARCRDLEQDAAAWALLQHVLAEVESDQARGVAARLEALTAELVPRLTGRNVREVRLDPSTLAPSEAQADGFGVLAKIDRFSRGTREQVALACRLQIGLLLAQEARHMLLLDDPLAHTDPARHREALGVLIELAERLQVIIFTCHHDRYAPLWTEGPARRIEIGR